MLKRANQNGVQSILVDGEEHDIVVGVFRISKPNWVIF